MKLLCSMHITNVLKCTYLYQYSVSYASVYLWGTCSIPMHVTMYVCIYQDTWYTYISTYVHIYCNLNDKSHLTPSITLSCINSTILFFWFEARPSTKDFLKPCWLMEWPANCWGNTTELQKKKVASEKQSVNYIYRNAHSVAGRQQLNMPHKQDLTL